VNDRAAAIAERIAEGMVAVWRDRVRHIDGHVIDEYDGIVVCLSNLAPDQNAALVQREPQDALDALAHAERIFGSREQAFGIDVERGRHASVDRAVRERGLGIVMTEPAMAVRVDDVAPPVVPAGVDLVRVTEPELLSQLVDVEIGSFDTDRAVVERLLGSGQLSLPNVRWYAAVVGGRPVAQAYTNTSANAVAVFGVGTVPEFRGHGIGTALTAFAIRDAPGADLAWLMSTEDGRSMYERMGFERVSDWEVWVRR
jgi:GNAT superfamily N-acetyltransferase